MSVLTRGDLQKHFGEMGVAPGGTVLVHSSFKSLGAAEGGPKAVVDALLDVLGESGTLLVPTFNFQSWTEGHYFDIAHTPSTMGAITEVARTDGRFRRTTHPIYSWVVAGRARDELVAVDTSHCYGPGTLFDEIHKRNALMLSLGLGWNDTYSLTHHVEKISGACTYRYDKPFSGIYVGPEGTPALRTYSMMVRDVSRGVKTNIIPAMEDLIRLGAIATHKIGPATCHASWAKDFAAHLLPIVRQNPERLHMLGKSRV